MDGYIRIYIRITAFIVFVQACEVCRLGNDEARLYYRVRHVVFHMQMFCVACVQVLFDGWDGELGGSD